MLSFPKGSSYLFPKPYLFSYLFPKPSPPNRPRTSVAWSQEDTRGEGDHRHFCTVLRQAKGGTDSRIGLVGRRDSKGSNPSLPAWTLFCLIFQACLRLQEDFYELNHRHLGLGGPQQCFPELDSGETPDHAVQGPVPGSHIVCPTLGFKPPILLLSPHDLLRYG